MRNQLEKERVDGERSTRGRGRHIVAHIGKEKFLY